jgi:hypothetical protein
MPFRLLYKDYTSLFTVYESPLGQLVYTHQCTNLPYNILYESLYCIRDSAYTRLRLYETPLIRESAPPFQLTRECCETIEIIIRILQK